MDNILSLESVLSGAGYDDDMSLEMEGMDAVTACELSDVFEDVTTLEANLVICEAAKKAARKKSGKKKKVKKSRMSARRAKSRLMDEGDRVCVGPDCESAVMYFGQDAVDFLDEAIYEDADVAVYEVSDMEFEGYGVEGVDYVYECESAEYDNILTVEGNTWDKIVDKVREAWQALVDFIKSVFLKIKAFFLNTERYWKDNKDDIKAGIAVAKADDKVSLKHGIIANKEGITLVDQIANTISNLKSIQTNIDRLTDDTVSKNILTKGGFSKSLRNVSDTAKDDKYKYRKTASDTYKKGTEHWNSNSSTWEILPNDDSNKETRTTFVPNSDKIVKFLERMNDILNAHGAGSAIEYPINSADVGTLEGFMCTKVLITNLTEAKKFCSQQASNHRFKSGEGAKASLKFCKLVKKVISTCIRFVQMGSFEALKVCKAAVAKAGE